MTQILFELMGERLCTFIIQIPSTLSYSTTRKSIVTTLHSLLPCKRSFTLTITQLVETTPPPLTTSSKITSHFAPMSITSPSTHRPSSWAYTSTASDNSSSTSYQTNHLHTMTLTTKQQQETHNKTIPIRQTTSIAKSELVQSFGR